MSAQKRDTRNGRKGRRERRTTRWSAPALIGVGVDGHPGGHDAVVLGSMLAGATSAELMLIAVYEEPLLEGVVPPGMGWTSVRKQAQAMLAQTRDSFAPEARIVVQSDALVYIVRLQHRDLLVVGSAHDANAGHVMLPGTAGELLCHLECPLAIAPRGMRDHASARLQRIGVGFDGTPESDAALGLAGAIALAADADLYVRGLVDDRVAGGLRTEDTVLAGDAIVARQLASLSDRAWAGARATRARTRVDVTPGVAVESLRELCDHVDLLVLGSGHSGPPGRVQLGSTGKTLLGDATRPVLVVPRA